MERKIEDIILDEINEVLQHYLMHAELESTTGETQVNYRYIAPVDKDQYADPENVIDCAMDSIRLNIDESCKKVADRFEFLEFGICSVSSPEDTEIQVNIGGKIKE